MALATAAVFGFLYFKKEPTVPEDESTGTNFFSQFNPFGTKSTPETTPPKTTPETPPATEQTAPKLVKISSMPVAGFTVFSKERLKDIPVTTSAIPPATAPKVDTNKKPTSPLTEFAPALRYASRETGNIYQTFADKIEERKFSTTVIPKVYEAYFGNRGESVIMRYLKRDEKTIETFVGTLPKELLGGDGGDNQIKGSFLPDNVKDISISSDGSKIFYLFTSGDNMVGTILNLLNNKKVQIFDSAFTEWLSFWPTNNIVTLTTKPAANIFGYMYTIDSTGKNLSKILGDINGLTTQLSPNGKLILYSNDNLSLYIHHIDGRNSDVLGIKTLSEKCVWGKASNVIYCATPKSVALSEYPDSWYQGEVSFSDQFWKVDVETGNATMLMDPVTIAKEEIDGIKLALDEDENYLFFVNKKDSFLWKLDLK